MTTDEYIKPVYYYSISVDPIMGTKDTDNKVVHKRTNYKGVIKRRNSGLTNTYHTMQNTETYPSIILVTTAYYSIRILESYSFSLPDEQMRVGDS